MKIVLFRHIFIVLFLIIIPLTSFSQIYKLKGAVIDSSSGKALAFVNIVYNSDNRGTSSNIDGKFSIESKSSIEFLKFSYLGYQSKRLLASDIKNNKPFVVLLKKEAHNLNEVTILPGINPAHRIINKVIENKDSNNPEKLTSFSYTSYNKLFFTIDLKNKTAFFDTIKLSDAEIQKYDSLLKANIDTIKSSYLPDLVNLQHLFLMETISERKFIYPDKNKEKVIATKVSGIQSPSFVILATQLQSFSFYKEMVNISDKYYISPICKGATKKYLFIIEDTLYTETKDTVFVISYQPSKGKNFDGLKGILNINSRNYAIESVVAEPYEQSKIISFKIQQKYKLIDNKQWFPVELNTNLLFHEFKLYDKTDTILLGNNKAIKIKKNYPLLGVGKSYLNKIRLDTLLDNKKFGAIELDYENDSHKKSDEFWNYYRNDTLTAKEIKTYHVIDSIGKKAKLDKIMRITEAMTRGYIPISCFNVEYNSLMRYNEFEGFRFGLGLLTNEKIIKWASVGGYVAYGLKDKGTKYGGNLIFNINKSSDVRLKLIYSNDINESGESYFIDNIDINSTEMYRNYLIKDLYHIEKRKVEISFRTFRYLKANISYNQNTISATNNYLYDNLESIMQNSFISNEVSLRFRYAFKEKYIKTPTGYKISMGTKYPIIWANIIKGIDVGSNTLEYLKLETKLYKSFVTKNFGKSTFTIIGGYIKKPLPYLLQYNGHGSYRPVTVETSNSFATMRMNEFISDKFVYLFFQHDFSSLIFKTDKLKPKLVLCHNVGYGTLSNPQQHFNIPYKTMEKIYFESGIMFKNLIMQKYIGYGFGFYYRYGKYAFFKLQDNFALKLTFNFDI